MGIRRAWKERIKRTQVKGHGHTLQKLPARALCASSSFSLASLGVHHVSGLESNDDECEWLRTRHHLPPKQCHLPSYNLTTPLPLVFAFQNISAARIASQVHGGHFEFCWTITPGGLDEEQDTGSLLEHSWTWEMETHWRASIRCRVRTS